MKIESKASPVISNRYEAVLLIEVQHGNPNGDPGNGGKPRVSPATGQGLISDGCLKRKIRDYIALTQEGVPGFEIYVANQAILSEQQARAYAAVGLEAPPEEVDDAEIVEETEAPVKKTAKKAAPKKQPDVDKVAQARDWMASTFFDVRAFGAVFAGKGERAMKSLRGPVTVTFGGSIDPVQIQEHSITRVAVATTRESLGQQGRNQMMGRKYTIPYALYRVNICISPFQAKQTGFTEADLQIIWQALENMWDHDRSAGRGLMAMRGLVVFKHSSALGNAPARDLFDRVTVTRESGADVALSFMDYRAVVDEKGLPPGIEVIQYPKL